MTQPDRETESIREALEELRAAESRRLDMIAPSFRALLARPRNERTPLRLYPARLAAAAATLAIVALSVFGYRAAIQRPERLTLPPEVAMLAAWRPITDVLLETPGRHLLREMPPLGSSIITFTTTGDTP